MVKLSCDQDGVVLRVCSTACVAGLPIRAAHCPPAASSSPATASASPAAAIPSSSQAC